MWVVNLGCIVAEVVEIPPTPSIKGGEHLGDKILFGAIGQFVELSLLAVNSPVIKGGRGDFQAVSGTYRVGCSSPKCFFR